MNRELEIVYDTTAFFVDGTRVLEDVGLLGYASQQDARLVEQPLENGSSIIDHKIDNLTVVSFIAVLPPHDFKNAYEVLRNYYTRGVIFSIKTPLQYFDSAVIQDISHQISANTPDRIEMFLVFKQYQFFQAEFAELSPSNVGRPGLSSTVDRGTQRGDAVQVDQSTAFRLLNGS